MTGLQDLDPDPGQDLYHLSFKNHECQFMLGFMGNADEEMRVTLRIQHSQVVKVTVNHGPGKARYLA